MEGAQKQIGDGISRSLAAQRWNAPHLRTLWWPEKALDKTQSRRRKNELDCMAAMLSRPGGRGYQVEEDSITYESTKNDFDPDPDSDPDSSEEGWR